ncbi:MAG TPA: hypothetical protein VHX42_03780, partial [Candidatus Babeliales bacterium]|nr:hypothetical protein [Candidatus Babeliales bacterium]
HYSRITNCQKKRTGVAELRIKIGTSYISENYFQLNYYSILGIPTGNKQNGEIMFEAVNGNNHHLGIGAGINMQAPLNRDTTAWAFCAFLDLESVILIRNKQFRTYDLIDQFSQNSKPWSRFMLVNLPLVPNQPFDLATTTNLPGVNFFTQKIYAKPFNVVDFALGWRLKVRSVEGEVGYSIWGHPTERTNLNTPICQPFGIAGSAPGKTASRSTIAQQAPDDLDFVPVTRFDLDRSTGESSGGFTQRAIASLGWAHQGDTIGGVFGIGGSVDIPFETSLLQLWKVWGKISLTF